MPVAEAVRGRWAADGFLVLLLFAAIAVYLSLLPYNLGLYDESYFLYEAKRIRDGEVYYRDIFQIATPLPAYVMAGLFWLFGTSMTTARVSTAVLHATTGVVLYATARRLAVRRELAVAVALAYPAVCVAIWPYASWHWFSTLIFSVLLLVMIAGRWAARPQWAFVPGLITGVLTDAQHQKGVVIAAGVCVVFVLDHLIDRRYPNPEPWPRVATRLIYFAAGVAALVVPVLAGFVLVAGADAVYAALVRFPLENYRTTLHQNWGVVGPMARTNAAYSFPAILRYSPVALALPAVECLVHLAHGRERERVRALTALLVLSGFFALSIMYFPGVIHIAFIAVGFWLCAAVGVEWLLSGLRPVAIGRLAGALVAVLVSAGLIVHLSRLASVLREQFPVERDTAFGRVAFPSIWQASLAEGARELLAQSASGELFCYILAAPYLTTGGRNPTPYQFLKAGISPDRHIQETLSILEERRVPYVIAPNLNVKADDPVVQYIGQHYEPMDLADNRGGFPWYWLLARKDRAPASPPPAGS